MPQFGFTLEIRPLFRYPDGRPYWYSGLCRQIMEANKRNGTHHRCLFFGKTPQDIIEWFLREQIANETPRATLTPAQIATAEALANEERPVESPYAVFL